MVGWAVDGDEPSRSTELAGKNEMKISLLEHDYAELRTTRRVSGGRRARRSRNMWLVAAAMLVAVVLMCMRYLRPHWQEEWELRQGFLASKNETYEVEKTKHFDGVKIQELDSSLVPGGEDDPEGKRRLIFVGDIHGCADELRHLLHKVEFDEKLDHLVAVGDVVSKGPKSPQVLDELMRVGASSVRGNHEDRLLELVPSVVEMDNLPEFEIASKKGREKDMALLKEFSRHHLQYLRDMPLMLRIPALPQATKPTSKDSSPIVEEILVVHAGLVPAVPLERQDPYFVMNMRSIRWRTHVPLVEAKDKKKKSKPWHKIWEWYNDRLFRKKSFKGFSALEDALEAEGEAEGSGPFDDLLSSTSKKKSWPQPQIVVYGHHSKAGLKISRWSKGLDTGCVKGERLTALVLDARGRQKLVSVGCKKHS